LRQAHLQRLGWRFHRVWSTDWFYEREQETERALAACEEAVRWADLSDTDAVRASTTGQPEALPLPQPLRRQRGPRPVVPARESIDQYSDQDLRQIAEWVASDGLLRTDEELIREIFGALPFERLGSRIRERLETVVNATRRDQRR
jgi:hypothetical protein